MVRVASISKFITALAILHLRDLGQLDLDQPFLGILTDYQVAAGGDPRLRDITIRMLLLHAGGWEIDFTDQAGVVARALGVQSPPTPRDIVRYVITQPLHFAPGTKIVYSNVGYRILGEVVAKLSGQTYESYVRDQILARAAGFICADSRAQMMIDTHLPDAELLGTPEHRWRGLALVIGPTTATYAHGGLSAGSQAALHRRATGHTFSIVTNIRVDRTDDLYNELVSAVEEAIATLPADATADLYPQYPSTSLPARNP